VITERGVPVIRFESWAHEVGGGIRDGSATGVPGENFNPYIGADWDKDTSSRGNRVERTPETG
jgi:hypothetical protein